MVAIEFQMRKMGKFGEFNLSFNPPFFNTTDKKSVDWNFYGKNT